MTGIGSLARISCLAVALILAAARTQAGPIFLTGHDPDFHAAAGSTGAMNLLTAGLQFVTGNTFNSGQKFLWVESFTPATFGHIVGETGLTTLGLVAGVDFDWVDASGFSVANLSNYDAIAIASSFGGMLSQAELDGLIARSADIATFVNSGGGLFASAECFPASSFCFTDTLGAAPNLFGFLPITVSSVGTIQGYTLTSAGQAMFPTLTNADMNDPTHNSFSNIPAALTIVDVDSAGTPTTLAGNVNIGGGGITPVPEPGSMFLLGGGVLALVAGGYRRRQK